MARTAEAANEAVQDGSRKLRKRALEVGKAGAEVAAQVADAAEQRLAEGAETARDEATKTSRRSRKKLAAQAKRTRKELSKSTKRARKVAAERTEDLRAPGRKAKKAAVKAAKAAGESKRKAKKDFKAAKKDFKSAIAEAQVAAKGEKRKRKKLPWLLALGALAGAAAFALRSKQEPPVAPAPPRSTDTPEKTTPEDPAQRNGQHAKSPEPKTN